MKVKKFYINLNLKDGLEIDFTALKVSRYQRER